MSKVAPRAANIVLSVKEIIPREILNGMHSTPFLIGCLINNLFYTKSLIDTCCLCYSAIDENLVRNYYLKVHNITERSLRLADGLHSIKICKIACVDMDIDGRHEKIWGYVMPHLAYPIILGKAWMEKNVVVYLSKRRCIRIGTRRNGQIVRERGWYEDKSPKKNTKANSTCSL